MFQSRAVRLLRSSVFALSRIPEISASIPTISQVEMFHLDVPRCGRRHTRSMPLAVEQVRRVRRGAQAHLTRCEDGCGHALKFHNNPQGARDTGERIAWNRSGGALGTADTGRWPWRRCAKT
jgi:hypothetical protein